MECVNLSWLLSPWFLGALLGAFCVLVLLAMIGDLRR